jgi:cell division protein ZipA
MDDLRLILLGAGALVIGVVWWVSQASGRRSGPAAPLEPSRRTPPVVNDDPERTTPARASVELRTRPAPEQPGGFDPERQKIIALHVMPAPDQRFLGADVLEALDDAGLKYGRRDVFHRLHEQQTSATIYQVANMVEPGGFDLKTLPGTWVPGLTFFMVLPGPKDGVAALADMLATARRVAERLHGEVKDQDRSTLTRQTAHHLREQVIAFQHRQSRGIE